MSAETLGAAIDRLGVIIDERAAAPADQSYTAALMVSGQARCAKKLGEEGVEAAIATAMGDKEALTSEAADVLYHLLVALRVVGVAPSAVAAELARREGVSGLAEKAARSTSASD